MLVSVVECGDVSNVFVCMCMCVYVCVSVCVSDLPPSVFLNDQSLVKDLYMPTEI